MEKKILSKCFSIFILINLGNYIPVVPEINKKICAMVLNITSILLLLNDDDDDDD